MTGAEWLGESLYMAVTAVFVRFSRASYSRASPFPYLELKNGRAAACAVGLRALKLTVLALLRCR